MKVFIRTFGCQANDRDSEMLYSLLLKRGWKIAESEEDADCILFNTCSVREHAEDKVWSELGALKKVHKYTSTQVQRKNLIIGLIGCMGQNYKEKIFEKAPIVNFVAGPSNILQIPDIIEEILKKRKKIQATDLDSRPRVNDLKAFGYRRNKIKALVSISHGCNNFCSYCIVPYVRGSEKSVSMADILKEVKYLAEKGYKEVMLLGQNVNSYNSTSYIVHRTSIKKNNEVNFIKLLEKVNEVKGIERIRFMTSHPKDAHVELFKAMRDLPKVCEHLHLPLQSGSDRILKVMNRRYASKDYLKLTQSYKKIIPGGSITTDIIVGFPGETDEDFKATYNLIKLVEFDSSFVFKYSLRSGTKASKMRDDVTREIKEKRNQLLLGLQSEISRKNNLLAIGKEFEILVEGISRRNNLLTGRTRTNKNAIFEGNKNLIGKLTNVEVEGLHANTLLARKVG